MIRKSQAPRDHTLENNLTLISISRFSMKHVHPGWGAATPPSPRPLKFWATQIFWAAREIWADQIFTKISMFRFVFFFFERVIFYFILENEQKRYAIFRRVRGLGHTTVSELLMAI